VALQITLACSACDRTQGLLDGSVAVEGTDLTVLALPVEEIFYRMARFGEFDAAEFSLSSYLVSLQRDDPPFVAIPAFPSRAFRHSSVYVHAGGGIARPGDLVGKTVGMAEYQLTANVWVRGILAEQYGVPVQSVSYLTGGLHEPGRPEKLPVSLPPGVRVQPIGPGQTLAQMLVDGEIDALYTPRTPEPFAAGRPEVVRLFPDYRREEEHYFAATGVFPIMHLVVLRRELYLRYRWLAGSLLKAFEAARRRALDGLEETATLKYALPWLGDDAARTRALLGQDYWPYGIPQNARVLDTFLRYAGEQGLTSRQLNPADLFAPETLEHYVI
jgi:4,5-dihydroxyphthalate decarboxylase